MLTKGQSQAIRTMRTKSPSQQNKNKMYKIKQQYCFVQYEN